MGCVFLHPICQLLGSVCCRLKSPALIMGAVTGRSDVSRVAYIL